MLRFLANLVLGLWLVGVLLAVLTLPFWVSSDVSYTTVNACAGKYHSAPCNFESTEGKEIVGQCQDRLHFMTCVPLNKLTESKSAG